MSFNRGKPYLFHYSIDEESLMRLFGVVDLSIIFESNLCFYAHASMIVLSGDTDSNYLVSLVQGCSKLPYGCVRTITHKINRTHTFNLNFCCFNVHTEKNRNMFLQVKNLNTNEKDRIE